MVKGLKYNIVRNLFIGGIFLFSVSFLLPENLRNIPLFIFIITILISFSLPKQPFIKSNYNSILLYNIVFYIIMVLSLLYSENIGYGLKRITTMVALLIIPLCFYFVSIKKQINYEKFINYFYICFFVSTVLFFIGVLIKNYFDGYLNETIFIHTPERLNAGYGKHSIHPLYASMYLSISIFFSIPLLAVIKKRMFKIGLIIATLFLVMVLIALARKGPIIITFIVFLIYFLTKEKKARNVFYYGLAIALFIIIAYNIAPIGDRFLELAAVLMNDTTTIGSTSLRLNIFDCSIEAIKNSPIFGYGIGDVENILQQCYTAKETVFKGTSYNSHNQFLSAWLSSGILGVASLLILFFYNFKKAFKAKDVVYISVLTLFFFMMLTENILDRQNGVILFAFFINFFAFKNTKQPIT